MGNSSSTQNSGGGGLRRFSSPNSNPKSDRERIPNTHPHAPRPHRSLRVKKKSLELPDLAPLSLNPYQNHQPTAPYRSNPLPIPPQARQGSIFWNEGQPVDPDYRNRPRRSNNSSRQPSAQSSVISSQQTHSRPPSYRTQESPSTAQPFASTLEDELVREERSEDGNLVASGQYNPLATRTSIPAKTTISPAVSGELVEKEILAEKKERESLDGDEVMVKISWRGGGMNIFLARQGDDEWRGRRRMERESPDSNTFSTTIFLRSGTHHLRFLVDDQWRVADDLPTTVDQEGGLANYVAVGPGFDGTAPPATTSLSKIIAAAPSSPPPQRQGYSFWTDDDDNDFSERPYATIKYTPYIPQWTSEIPLELIEAAQQEETFLAHQHMYQGYEQGRGRTQHVNGFVPLPNIPPAPRLPRILDKLILNQPIKVGVSQGVPLAGASLVPGAGKVSERERRKERDKRNLGMTAAEDWEDRERERAQRPLPVTTASGTDVSASRASTDSQATVTGPSRPMSPPRVNPGERPMSPPRFRGPPTPMPTVVDNRTIADDTSVLPVPSHVVLHHLCTSAIKNGVLAVGETVRYRKKYLTTIYYKPT
ncbi:snf1 kinase complex beta-subunit [Moniliophthora roreri MCA 2997]|uniref:Snf1 kinase complex beta-subunit n=3 Tax=Moniliophthora roreri TaxID=221103 RepID=V2XAI6_MONRO|nr:snf1 kinase complex beta-subunit [Moniliophthora roreri MCA 2997]KAI3622372.1 snf1 kinase complex beta-subunit [Moniliophthora roreri]